VEKYLFYEEKSLIGSTSDLFFGRKIRAEESFTDIDYPITKIFFDSLLATFEARFIFEATIPALKTGLSLKPK
jgi:hypothetical protein